MNELKEIQEQIPVILGVMSLSATPEEFAGAKIMAKEIYDLIDVKLKGNVPIYNEEGRSNENEGNSGEDKL